MSSATWHEALPSDASLVAVSPTDMRSHWTSIAVGLINTLYWAGSGGASQLSSGELYRGATRTFLGALSVSSNAAANLGKLFLSSDGSDLYLYESDRTHRIGGPGTVSHGSSPFGGVWVEQRGTFSADEDLANASFATVYGAAPQVYLTDSEADGTDAWIVALTSVSSSNFTISSQYIGSGLGGPRTIRWMSLGTRAAGEF